MGLTAGTEESINGNSIRQPFRTELAMARTGLRRCDCLGCGTNASQFTSLRHREFCLAISATPSSIADRYTRGAVVADVFVSDDCLGRYSLGQGLA
ncbi:hypothetical protein RMSM_02615 [Rhodopirellula maiorica SM1]|uniref:Uncharacterized protein n=1 Tax=Rhodopirellula maiorica SM1 TaxID=1265738 RepID=M5RMA9_9BACT|nr:hypothetical protein RMSM_02615 [Rhodopirellula maiorica SM1]